VAAGEVAVAQASAAVAAGEVAAAASAAVVAGEEVEAAVVAVNPDCRSLSAEKSTMRLKNTMKTLAVALLIGMAPAIHAAPPSPAVQTIVHKTFATPEDAAAALAEAVRAQDVQALLGVVGPSSRSWLSSGDTVADREDWRKFLAAYDQKHSVSKVTDSRAVLLVGDGDWPFPAPLVRQGETWAFDAVAGREEIINRRVGRNELDAIQTLLAIVDAQREYAAADPDGNGSPDYARRFMSSEGTKDGLFWPAGANEPASPLGPLVGAATREGYSPKAQPEAYHGYRYRMLTAQGKDAPGGAYGYLVKDRMLGGFAVLAYPARYGVSGVMSFVTNHDGIVYQKNLGRNTDALAAKMQTFNPDASWRKVE